MATLLKKEASPPAFDPSGVEHLLGACWTADELDDFFRRMKKVLMERVLAGELTQHLAYGRGEAKPAGQTKHWIGPRPRRC